MASPRIPGTDPDAIQLPCDDSVDLSAIDLGMREYRCACGDTHAVVMDVHPASRFFPAEVVEVLRATIEPADGSELGTAHLMGMAIDEFPEAIAHTDVSENGRIGCQHVWIAAFDSRRLHEVLVDLVLEVMEHAMSHTEDDAARAEFDMSIEQFDVETFVERYRAERDLERPGA